jgi:hypothetical protein
MKIAFFNSFRARKKPGIAAGLAKGLFIYFLLIW